MKAIKWLVVLLAVVAVVAVVASLLRRKGMTPTAASLLPADTFLFVQMPDVVKARSDFKTTGLWRIWSEKEVQDFLGRTTSAARAAYQEKVGGNAYVSLVQRGMRLAEGEVFLAVPELGNVQRSVPPMVLGVDVRRRRAEADQWLADVKAKLKGSYSDLTEDSQRHSGVMYRRWTSSRATICQAYFGSLLVIASSEKEMQAMIDRHLDAKAPRLESESRYTSARGKMPPSYAALVYCNPKPLAALLKGFALFVPQLQSVVSSIDAVQSVSYTTTLDGGSFKDVFFVNAPADKRGNMGSETVPTERTTLPLTTDQTLFYLSQSVDLGKAWDTLYQQLQQAPAAKLQEALFQIEKFNRDNKMNMPRDLLDAVGPEYGIALSWEPSAPYPEFFVAMQVRDKAKADAALGKLWEWGKSAGQKTGLDPFADTPYQGQMIHSLQTPYVTPSFTVTEKFLFLTVQSDTAKKLIDKLKPGGGKTLADNATYQQTMKALPSGGYSYSYLDTSNLFVRTYNVIKPLIQEHANLVPMLGNYVDVNKLPQPQTISQYLKPSASAQVVDKDGFTTVMVSPVGAPAVMVTAMVGAGVAIAQQFPNFRMK